MPYEHIYLDLNAADVVQMVPVPPGSMTAIFECNGHDGFGTACVEVVMGIDQSSVEAEGTRFRGAGIGSRLDIGGYPWVGLRTETVEGSASTGSFRVQFMSERMQDLTARAGELFQAMPTATTTTQVYSPGNGKRVVIDSITIANHHTANVDVTVYKDLDGSSYGDATTLLPAISMAGNSVTIMEGPMDPSW